jgi:phosphatidylglycerophosphatase A
MPPTPPHRRLTPAVWMATGLGIGLKLPAPGTFGSLWGLPLAWVVSEVGPWWQQLIAIAALLLVGVPLTARASADLGGAKDPGAIVWDEIASMPLVFLLVPLTTWWIAAAGFALFRLFDISKPWPCRQLERLPGGWGVMADDVGAALYAMAALTALSYGWTHWVS